MQESNRNDSLQSPPHPYTAAALRGTIKENDKKRCKGQSKYHGRTDRTILQQQFSQKILEDNSSELETDGTVTLKVQPITAWCTIKHRDNFHEPMSICYWHYRANTFSAAQWNVLTCQFACHYSRVKLIIWNRYVHCDRNWFLIAQHWRTKARMNTTQNFQYNRPYLPSITE